MKKREEGREGWRERRKGEKRNILVETGGELCKGKWFSSPGNRKAVLTRKRLTELRKSFNLQ